MAFVPASFYTLADELRLKAQTDGAHLRTLISRAYYGALIVARDSRGVDTKGDNSSHRLVIAAYAGNNAEDDMVADALRKLKKLREKADYEPNYALCSKDGLQALAQAKRALTTLNALPGRLDSADLDATLKSATADNCP